jgi:DNA helicase-2/ATP-dependent DNA helicase PcrA
VAGFLENITLAGDIDSYDTREESVTMMTLHAAKGLEFPVVFMPALEQGLLPHERSLNSPGDVEEERRLCFVGMTRAMEELHLSCARMREFRGRTIYTVPSMFLGELPGEVRRTERGVSETGGRDAAWLDGGAPVERREPSRPAPARPASTAAAAAAPCAYEAGNIVQHDSYGLGQVLEVSGHGATRKVRIRFVTQGIRTFLVDKVALRKVARGG